MSPTSGTCIVCQKQLRSPLTCLSCQLNYHRNCLITKLNNKTLKNCCVKQFGYLAPSDIETRSKSATESRSPLTLNSVPAFPPIGKNLKSTLKNSKNASASSYKSATLSPSTPVSPLLTNFPISDSVFSPLSNNKMSQFTKLPDNWSTMNTDEKLTSMMTVFLTSTKMMSDKIDEFGETIKSLQEKVTTNTSSIKKLETDFVTLKHDSIANSTSISNEMCKLREEVVGLKDAAGSSQQRIPSINASDLLISGIPESIASKLTPLQVSSSIFNKLGVSHLTNDILSSWKVGNRRVSSNANTNNDQRSFNCSYFLRMKSAELRNHILSVKKKLKILQVADAFPDHIDAAFR
ncbi:hypothetical protein KQX54_010885, partial [Cotesia glomerata]